MANEKDVTEKTLEAYNDVFADIVNVLVFKGKQVIKEDELEDALPRSHYKADGKIRELERDVAKYWKKFGIRIALVGLENQSKQDKYMPVRTFGYDGTAYRQQLSNVDDKKKPIAIYPVITLVLYFGKRHWKKYRYLHEVFDIPKGFEKYFNDYKINLFEIAFLSDEQVKMFKSDFKIVADYFVQSRKNRSYDPPDTVVNHVYSVLELMAAMTNDTRFEDALNDPGIISRKKVNMGEIALDKIEMKGYDRARKEMIENALRIGKTPQEISDFNSVPLQEVLNVEKGMPESVDES